MDHTLGDIPLQQKPLDVLVATRRVKRPAQGLVPANTRDLRVYIRPIRVTLAKQLPCRGVRREQGQIPLAGIRMVRNVPTSSHSAASKGRSNRAKLSGAANADSYTVFPCITSQAVKSRKRSSELRR